MYAELSVNVGDKVLLSKGYHYSLREIVSEVVKITPTGRIRIKDSSAQFDKYGRKMGGGDWDEPCSIRPITDEEIAELKERNKRKSAISKANDMCHKVTVNNLTYEQAVKIIEILGDES